jgi:hypothetical protein
LTLFFWFSGMLIPWLSRQPSNPLSRVASA